jgi:hypothetical protein
VDDPAATGVTDRLRPHAAGGTRAPRLAAGRPVQVGAARLRQGVLGTWRRVRSRLDSWRRGRHEPGGGRSPGARPSRGGGSPGARRSGGSPGARRSGWSAGQPRGGGRPHDDRRYPVRLGARRAALVALLLGLVALLCMTGFMAAYRPDVLGYLFG